MSLCYLRVCQFSGKCKEALEIFSKMQEAKVQPDKAACNILVEKLSKVGETLAMSQICELEVLRVCELEVLRKENKRLQTHGHSWDITPIEEKVCDLIFVGDVIFS